MAFRWRVSAVHAGANVVTLSLAITYTLRSGTQEQGQIEVTPDAIPIRAVDASPVTILPNVRIEIVGLVSLVGLGSILGFIWNIYSLIEKVLGILATIRKLFRRLFHRRRTKRRRTPPSSRSDRTIPPTTVSPPSAPPLAPTGVSHQHAPHSDHVRHEQ